MSIVTFPTVACVRDAKGQAVSELYVEVTVDSYPDRHISEVRFANVVLTGPILELVTDTLMADLDFLSDMRGELKAAALGEYERMSEVA